VAKSFSGACLRIEMGEESVRSEAHSDFATNIILWAILHPGRERCYGLCYLYETSD